MGMQLLWSSGVAGVTGLGGGFNVNYIQDENDDRSLPQFNWNYQLRDAVSQVSQSRWQGLWPRMAFISGDSTAALAPFGQDLSDGTSYDTSFELWSASRGGAARHAFLMGQVQNTSGAALAGANLYLYLTATGQLVNTGVSDQNGNYQLGSIFPAANHQIYVNYGPNTLTGGSANNLTPNF